MLSLFLNAERTINESTLKEGGLPLHPQGASQVVQLEEWKKWKAGWFSDLFQPSTLLQIKKC